ncbi:MAG: isocitrate lyase/phosphoenolpyruvate mutase family protein [Solirubrobacterales bacterium]
MSSTRNQEEKALAFRDLHEGDGFVLPNPWDAGSAKALAALGFDALATTSSGFAFTLGRRDGDASLDEVVEHLRALDAATDLPVSADLENGYGSAPEDAATAVSRAAEAGAVGGSIEDFDPEDGIYELGHARARIAAAVEAAAGTGFEFTLTARAENHIRGNPDLDDTIARLRAYEEAGADVLYAPGLASPEQIRTVCEAVSKPVNVLALPNLSLEQVFAAGAQRVSLGGSLAWVAVDGLVAAATAIRDQGDLSSLAISDETNRLLG